MGERRLVPLFWDLSRFGLCIGASCRRRSQRLAVFPIEKSARNFAYGHTRGFRPWPTRRQGTVPFLANLG